MKDQKAEEQRFSIKCAAGNDRAMADGLETCPRTKSHSWQHVSNMTITGEMIEQIPWSAAPTRAGKKPKDIRLQLQDWDKETGTETNISHLLKPWTKRSKSLSTINQYQPMTMVTMQIPQTSNTHNALGPKYSQTCIHVLSPTSTIGPWFRFGVFEEGTISQPEI